MSLLNYHDPHVYEVLKRSWIKKNYARQELIILQINLPLIQHSSQLHGLHKYLSHHILAHGRTLKLKCVLLGWDEKRIEKSACPSGSLLFVKLAQNYLINIT